MTREVRKSGKNFLRSCFPDRAHDEHDSKKPPGSPSITFSSPPRRCFASGVSGLITSRLSDLFSPFGPGAEVCSGASALERLFRVLAFFTARAVQSRAENRKSPISQVVDAVDDAPKVTTVSFPVKPAKWAVWSCASLSGKRMKLSCPLPCADFP